jgi:RimJ/RimL family protein N-acetyltransferase
MNDDQTARSLLRTASAFKEVMMTDLSTWTPRPRPQRIVLDGRYVRLEPLSAARHGDGLFEAATAGNADERFLWLSETTPATRAEFQPWLEKVEASEDPLYFVCIDKATGKVAGRQTLMRIDPANGVIEIGHIHWGPLMQRRPAATEAHFLFMKHIFDDLGYRRWEWKCNDRNEPSKRAALRFGFTPEGVFRQAMVIKGENRDTAWFSIIDKEWPALRPAYEAWLDPANFDADGRQRVSLATLTARSIEGNDVVLRRIGPDQVPFVEDFQFKAYARVQEAIGAVPSPMTYDYAEMLETCEAWLAPGSDGLLILRRRPDDLYIESIATLPSAAGSGLGRGMMQATLERARALGMSKVRLLTNSLNPAVDWYRRIGFSVEREERLSDRVLVHMVATVD